MEIVTLGALIATFLVLVFVFVEAFRHIGQIDRERHIRHGHSAHKHAH